MTNLPSSRSEIEAHIPHRYPFIFLDRVISVGQNTIEVESFIKKDDPHFSGHFPGMPILPGVILIETVAQAGALLTDLTGHVENGKFMAFSSVETAKFKKPVIPDTILTVKVEIVKRRGPFFKYSGLVSENGQTVALVDFTAAQIDFKD